MVNRNFLLLIAFFIGLFCATVAFSQSKKFPEGTEGRMRWGGGAVSLRPEAVVANEASYHINRHQEKIKDSTAAVVAIPVRFTDSNYEPYGDKNTNAALSFGHYGDVLPLAALKIDKKVWFFANLKFLAQRNILEVAFYIEQKLFFQQINLVESCRSEIYEGSWEIPQAVNSPIFVRPFPNYNDWLALDFDLPIYSVDEFVSNLSPNTRTYDDGKDIIDPEQISSFESYANPRIKALQHRFPSYRYNVDRLTYYGNPVPYYVSNVHGSCFEDTTAVNYGRTWVAEKRTPFKTLYSCFDGRNVREESRYGAPTAIGWHTIGSPFVALGNTVETQSILVAHGYVRPWENKNIRIPSDSMTYGLTDVAVFGVLTPKYVLVSKGRGKDAAILRWAGLDSEQGTCVEMFFPPTFLQK